MQRIKQATKRFKTNTGVVKQENQLIKNKTYNPLYASNHTPEGIQATKKLRELERVRKLALTNVKSQYQQEVNDVSNLKVEYEQYQHLMTAEEQRLALANVEGGSSYVADLKEAEQEAINAGEELKRAYTELMRNRSILTTEMEHVQLIAESQVMFREAKTAQELRPYFVELNARKYLLRTKITNTEKKSVLTPFQKRELEGNRKFVKNLEDLSTQMRERLATLPK